MDIIFSKKLIFKLIGVVVTFMAFIFVCCYATSAKNQLDVGYALLNNKKVALEIASDPHSREIGLMYRDSLAENKGMIFIFDKSDEVGFWMKNVRIPLDMLFVSHSKIVKVEKDVPICKNDPCSVYTSDAAVDSVIELKDGFCDKYNIKAGQTIEFSPNIQKQISKIYN